MLKVDDKNKYLGLYNTAKEARAVHLEAKKKYHVIEMDDRVVIRERLKPINYPKYKLKGLL